MKKILLVGGCGYIGSYLFHNLKKLEYDVTVCDLLLRGNPSAVPVMHCDYAELESSFLGQFAFVLWFAGHSSVAASKNDPDGAVKNNCLNLFSFAKRLSSKTILIYASSASLYSQREQEVFPTSETALTTIPAQNAYDISKFAFDYLASAFLRNFYGLRLGTVSGYSPNLRDELVFNAMNISAATSFKLYLKNSSSHRTILFLNDLWNLIRKLMEGNAPFGFYNVGSVSLTLGELASRISSVWNAEIIPESQSETYSFILDLARMNSICGECVQATTFEGRCREFIAQYRERVNNIL